MKLEARITRMVGDEKLKAYASVVIDDSFIITGIKVIEGTDHKFISMPARKGKNATYYDICFPITKEFRQEITEVVLEAYKQKLEAL